MQVPTPRSSALPPQVDASDSPSAALLSLAARSHGVVLVGGSIPERSDGKLYNTCLVYGRDGRLLGRHRKVSAAQGGGGLGVCAARERGSGQARRLCLLGRCRKVVTLDQSGSIRASSNWRTVWSDLHSQMMPPTGSSSRRAGPTWPPLVP